MTESATNHVTGLENGSHSGWWSSSIAGGWGSGSGSGNGSGTGSGYSSSSSWGSPWSHSYDQTTAYPGFYEGAYYGMHYGNGREEYFAYLGDPFSDYPGSHTGFFAFAYSREEPWFAQAQAGNQRPMGQNPVPYNYRATLISFRTGLKPIDTFRPAHLRMETLPCRLMRLVWQPEGLVYEVQGGQAETELPHGLPLEQSPQPVYLPSRILLQGELEESEWLARLMLQRQPAEAVSLAILPV